MANITMPERKEAQAHDRAEYRLYFALAYPIFLIAAVLGRFMPRPGRARRTVFKEAAENAHSAIPWVFTGR